MYICIYIYAHIYTYIIYVCLHIYVHICARSLPRMRRLVGQVSLSGGEGKRVFRTNANTHTNANTNTNTNTHTHMRAQMIATQTKRGPSLAESAQRVRSHIGFLWY